MQRKEFSRAIRKSVTLSFAALFLSGCLEDKAETVDQSAFVPRSGNAPPVISGNPATAVNIGDMYSFAPNASDPDNDPLTFEIANKPVWANFDVGTGELTGRPTLGNVGTFSNIRISVDDGTATATLGSFSITVVTENANTAPNISGNPPSQVSVDTQYSFTPTASDADSDRLTFSISGLPDWATFSASNGRISGTPGDADVNTYSNIRITVSDTSNASDTLGPFSITVNAVSSGSITLSWTPPTENEDGTTLMDLDGYRIYWGTTPGNYPNSVTITNEGLSSYVVDNLTPGTYEFVATAFNAAGIESAYSNPSTKVVN